ncbi:hypothetical protein PVAND_000302 [Polypedilum vanderplanki]|uniref:Uncharacterized protein n=1 Tax=Polypedilum vanderplanki TaxID=319348 RepID=A0A9J6BK93_POLVA|nr:hypothetical protein PVAND_000302 [Polypedilum vanderplanki]
MEIENFVSSIVDEKTLHKLFLMSMNELNKWEQTETKKYDAIHASLITEKKNMIDLTEECRYMRNDHSFMINVCKASDQMQTNLKNTIENIKTVNIEINEIIEKITTECEKRDEKIIQLRNRDDECQAEIIEIEKEMKSQIQNSKQRVHQSKVKIALKEDSLAALEKTKSAKMEKYENIQRKLSEAEDELNNIAIDNIDDELKQLDDSLYALKNNVSEANINLQNAIEEDQNVNVLHNELNCNIGKYEAMVKKQEEIIGKLQTFENEKQNVLMSLLKAKIESELKNFYENNMSSSIKLDGEIKNLEEVRMQCTEVQKQCDEIKEKIDIYTSNLNEHKKNIINIMENMKAAKDDAEKNAPIKEIESLEEKIRETDEWIQQLNLNFNEIKNDIEKDGKTLLNDLYETSDGINDSTGIDQQSDSHSRSDISFSVDLRSIVSSLSVQPQCERSLQTQLIRKTRSRYSDSSNSSKEGKPSKKRRTQ